MLGDVVGGYLVKEALGSGRNGLLFLAVHVETGHRAVVQRRLGEDDVRLFGAEAAQVLGLQMSPHVERRCSRAGVAVFLALVDADAPGTGYTEYTNTERLPDLPPRPAPRRTWYLLGLSLLVIMGACIGGLLIRKVDQAPEPEPLPSVQAQALPPVDPSPKAAAPAPSGTSVRDAGQLVTAPSPRERPSSSPPRALKAAGIDGPSYCSSSSSDWKSRANKDLEELMARVAPYEELGSWAGAEEQAIGTGIAGATTESDCRAIEQRVGRFLRRVLAREHAP